MMGAQVGSLAGVRGWRAGLLWFRREGLLRNLISFYGIHFVNCVFPLITIPYLARTLQPAALGSFALGDAFARLLNIGIEYGFHLSASREVARHRLDREMRSRILAGVFGAQAILIAAATAVCSFAIFTVPQFAAHPGLMASGFLWACVQPVSLMWYLQGLESVGRLAMIDVFAKCFSTAAIWVFVQQPSDAWKVLALQAAAAFVTTASSFWLATGSVRLPRPSLCLGWDMLRKGSTIFFCRSAVTAYTTAAVILFSFFAPPVIVGYYAAAERICRAAVGTLHPIHQTLYPRIAHQLQRGMQQAARIAHNGTCLMIGYGLLVAAAIYCLAPRLVAVALGDQFLPAVAIVKLLAFLVPLNAASNALGLQWMVLLDMDREFSRIIILAGVLNVAMVCLLARLFGGHGMALSVLVAEAFVAVCVYIALWRRQLDPMTIAASLPGGERH